MLLFSMIMLASFFHFWRILLLGKINNSIGSNQEIITIKKISNNNSEILQKTEKEKVLEKIAQETNVRIFTTDNNIEIGGSGVLIKKENNTYFVVTNNHVINDINTPYNISTYDEKIYKGEVIKDKNNLNQEDLALLKFDSLEDYNIIKISQKPLMNNEVILASGFPFQKNLKQSQKLYYTMGKIEIILSKALIGGYQFGYTNLVHNGMSGGSILNEKGELIGLNGLGKYPIFGNPYIYEDGLIIDEKENDKMSELSWGIPVKKIEKFIENNN
ncbi:MAG: trypsin-like peptidase domain-containing protein [Cyanobacteria bacterium]|nr:trypsin-like peptidase domain-containing protein [Cyanobacteria bacterium CG_2015-22_32_23]NCS83742.1 trypsin-like peptidase domain-containing protein [Cyanobacteria bacterium CG_2015-02_32_10]